MSPVYIYVVEIRKWNHRCSDTEQAQTFHVTHGKSEAMREEVICLTSHNELVSE